MPKIVISYRRTDSDVTGRIFDRLVQRYGKDSVFRDIDNIPFGIDFRKEVNDALHDTDVLIAVVGPNWRGVDERGNARIDKENDPVRIEVETALLRNIPVIPVLVGGAPIPDTSELPESLKDFPFRNAAPIDSGRNFDIDVERVMRSMDRLFEGKTANGESAGSPAAPGDTQPKPEAVTIDAKEGGIAMALPASAVATSLDRSPKRSAETLTRGARRWKLWAAVVLIIAIGVPITGYAIKRWWPKPMSADWVMLPPGTRFVNRSPEPIPTYTEPDRSSPRSIDIKPGQTIPRPGSDQVLARKTISSEVWLRFPLGESKRNGYVVEQTVTLLKPP
jgi:hypothetical protein